MQTSTTIKTSVDELMGEQLARAAFAARFRVDVPASAAKQGDFQ